MKKLMSPVGQIRTVNSDKQNRDEGIDGADTDTCHPNHRCAKQIVGRCLQRGRASRWQPVDSLTFKQRNITAGLALKMYLFKTRNF